LLTVSTSAVLALMLLGVGSATAANPTWDIIIEPTPPKVGVGHEAGFVVAVENDGPSQINALSVTTTALETPTAAPVYISDLEYSTGLVAECEKAFPQTCQIGTLEAGVTVTFTVAYAVPTGASANCKNDLNQTVPCFRLEVSLRAGTGDTESDGKGKSRGDAYKESGFAEIGSGNFDGGFVFGEDVYQTNPNLGPRNIQATTLAEAQELVSVMIEDGITTNADCDAAEDNAACAGLFGEWSSLDVGDDPDDPPFTTPFKVTLMVRGSAVPGGATEEDIVVVHVLDDGTVDVIGDDIPDEETCAFSGTDPVPTNAECLTVTKVGGNWRIEVWLFRNGFVRGGI
jgi:hypothetical protein